MPVNTGKVRTVRIFSYILIEFYTFYKKIGFIIILFMLKYLFLIFSDFDFLVKYFEKVRTCALSQCLCWFKVLYDAHFMRTVVLWISF